MGGFMMWGFHMQNPYFILGMILVLIPLALDALDIYKINWSRIQSLGSKRKSKNNYLAFFMDGVLTTLIASPCAGPVMAAAISASFTLPLIYMPATFAAMGLGLGMPLLWLCLIPNLASKLPKSGNWMVWVKRSSGIGIVLMIAWLLKIVVGV
jgi:thiol:disulfide interchange protein